MKPRAERHTRKAAKRERVAKELFGNKKSRGSLSKRTTMLQAPHTVAQSQKALTAVHPYTDKSHRYSVIAFAFTCIYIDILFLCLLF